MNRIFRGYLFVILSAILFGCLPLAANIAYDNGLNSLSLVFYRNLFALPILYLPIRLRGEPLRVSRQEFTNILPLSILGFCITPALLFTSYNYLPAGTSTTFHFIYPAMTILGGVVLVRPKVGWGRVFCVLLCSVGILLFYEPGGALDPFGSAIALASGVTYALYIILLDYFRLESLSRFKLSFYISATCAAVMLVVCLVTGTFRLPGNALCLGVCFLTAFLAGAAANVLFQNGTLIIGGQRASILSTFEPIPLSPRPETLIMIFLFFTFLAIFNAPESAWLDSKAAIIPSFLAKNFKASNASSSLLEPNSTLPISFKCANCGPIPA